MAADLDLLEYSAVASERISKMIRASSIQALPMVPLRSDSFLDDAAPMPRWPSGLYSDFDAVHDGFCGLTVLAGPGGSGKSQQALACALENAMVPGTCVAYLDAENALGNQIERAVRWFGDRRSFEANMQRLSLHFHWFKVLPGMSWEQLMGGVSKRLMHDHERLLLVFDSISSLARCFEGNPLANSSRMYSALVSLVSTSEGRVRALALSELNKDGGVKGLEGVYASDLSIKLTLETDEGEGIVKMHMLKNRFGPLRPNLGLYEIDHRMCRLRKIDARAEDRSVPAAH
jgi:predicted ATP-dependent serine protease